MGLFEDLARVIGEAAATRLSAEFGGRRIYVPVAATAEDRIASAIGLEAAHDLSRGWGGERIFVPLDPRRGRRRDAICRLHDQGATVAEIARQTRCTERYVYLVLHDRCTS